MSERAKKITDMIYTTYGSDSDYLFGISLSLRHAVETIIKLALEYNWTIDE